MYEVAPRAAERPESLELEILDGLEFFKNVASDIAETTSGDRIAILTMSLEPNEPLVADVLSELHAATDRGVDAAFGVDAYALMIDDDTTSTGPLLLPMPFGQVPYQRRIKAFADLNSKENSQCAVINKPGRILTNPYAGRSHIKLAVINDKVYIGGPNFYKSDRIDMVVGIEDAGTADTMYDLAMNVIEAGNTDEVFEGTDQTWQIDDETRIILDAGKKNQSLILDTALQIIDDAQERLIGSFQFFPNGKVAEHLVAAHNNDVDVHVAHNHPATRGPLLGSVEFATMTRQKLRMPKELFADQAPKGLTLHGSAVANETTALVGSHNLVERGVKFGTPELVIMRRDPVFASDIGKLILSQVQTGVQFLPVHAPAYR